MNFIAHIHLSGKNEKLLVGNYIADLIRQKDVESLSVEIQKGIRLHRFIDSYTDQHPINRDTLDLLYERHRKYAPVLLDIYYDFFLIRHWSLFSSDAFIDTCDYTYKVLAADVEQIPLSAKPNIENLLNNKWLQNAYGSIAGLEKTFHFLKKRMSRPEWLQGASETLINLDAELDSAFLNFYPQLVAAVDDYSVESAV